MIKAEKYLAKYEKFRTKFFAGKIITTNQDSEDCKVAFIRFVQNDAIKSVTKK